MSEQSQLAQAGTKVYLAYECHYDYAEVWKNLIKIFADETEAGLWELEFKATDTDWREINEHTVE